VGSGIAIYSQNNLTATLKYRLHGRCSNNQAEQMAIVKALEHIQYLKAGGKNNPSVHRQPDNTSTATKPE
jgi:ribonuclease HI